MEKERRIRIAAIVLALGVVGVVGLAPSSAAEIEQASTQVDPGHCVTIDETGPGVRVDAASCERAAKDLIFDRSASALAGP